MLGCVLRRRIWRCDSAVQATEVKEASPEELIALAEEMGLDLSRFEIQER